MSVLCGIICPVALLRFTTSHFVASLVPKLSGYLEVSPARLALGAMTVGTAPTPPGGWSRPLIEICWRAAMVMANLEPDPVSDRWAKSGSYRRLDPSEKSAVS
jgi:hypothetical protein